MDFRYYLEDFYHDDFVEKRLASARRYQFGTASPLVAMIGAAARILRRASGSIERWAAGASEAGAQAPHVIIR